MSHLYLDGSSGLFLSAIMNLFKCQRLLGIYKDYHPLLLLLLKMRKLLGILLRNFILIIYNCGNQNLGICMYRTTVALTVGFI